MKIRFCPMCDSPMKNAHYCPVCRSWIQKADVIDVGISEAEYKAESHDDYEREATYSHRTESREEKEYREAEESKMPAFPSFPNGRKRQNWPNSGPSGRPGLSSRAVGFIIVVIIALYSVYSMERGTNRSESVMETEAVPLYDEDEYIDLTSEEVFARGTSCDYYTHMNYYADEMFSYVYDEIIALGHSVYDEYVEEDAYKYMSDGEDVYYYYYGYCLELQEDSEAWLYIAGDMVTEEIHYIRGLISGREDTKTYLDLMLGYMLDDAYISYEKIVEQLLEDVDRSEEFESATAGEFEIYVTPYYEPYGEADTVYYLFTIWLAEEYMDTI